MFLKLTNKILTRTFLNSTVYYKSIVPFNLSDIGEGIRYIKENDTIKQFDPICEVQSDKASVTISSRYDGVVKKIHSAIDEMVKVGKPLIDIEVDDDLSTDQTLKKIQPDKEFNHPEKIDDLKGANYLAGKNDISVKAIPMIRKLAKDLGVNISYVKGTGKEGRITEQDILHYNSTDINTQKRSGKLEIRGDIEKITGPRKVMIKSMNKSLEIPQFVLSELIEATSLLNLKKQLAQELHQTSIKMTIMPIIIKTASLALSKFPILNCRFNEAEESIHYQPFHNIGVAVDTNCKDLGLVVPNIKNVQNLSLREITKELDRIIQDCKINKKPRMDDLQNGTFTLSNIGAIGGIHAKPIIMWPEVSIAAIGKIFPQLINSLSGNIQEETTLHMNESKLKSLPRTKVDELLDLIKPVFYVSVSADHRIIDGATVAKFLKHWKHILEHPAACLVLDAA